MSEQGADWICRQETDRQTADTKQGRGRRGGRRLELDGKLEAEAGNGGSKSVVSVVIGRGRGRLSVDQIRSEPSSERCKRWSIQEMSDAVDLAEAWASLVVASGLTERNGEVLRPPCWGVEGGACDG